MRRFAAPSHAGSAVAAIALAAPLVGCSPSPPPPHAQVAVATPHLVPAAPRATPLVASDPCRSRARCEIEARHDAGVTASGHHMVVAELSLGLRFAEGELPAYERNCEQREVWLLYEGPGAPAPRALLSMCNDGYGASGRGEDTIDVGEGRITHVRVGGSAWWWSEATTAELDPPRVIEEALSGGWTLSQQHESTSRFDYRTFQGSDEAQWPACDAHGEMPDEPDDEAPSRGSQPIVATALPPRLTTGPIADAASVDVSACATRAESQEAPGDAAFALVMDLPSGTLLAQVRDDAFFGGDRLLVWATREDLRGGLHCWQSQKIVPLEIDPDGKVVAGAGANPGVTVEVGRSATSEARLFRVRLAGVPAAISVAYRDVDPHLARHGFATSDVEAHDGERVELGSVRRVDANRATCSLRGDVLAVELAAPPPENVPLLSGP